MPGLTCFSRWRLLAAIAVAVAGAIGAAPATAQTHVASCNVTPAPGVTALCAYSKGDTQFANRYYYVHVPPAFNNGTSAVVVDLHGFGLSAYLQKGDLDRGMHGSGELELSDKLNFVAVWPQGTSYSDGTGASWNAGTWTYTDPDGDTTVNTCCGAAAGYDLKGNLNTNNAAPDVDFLSNIILDVEGKVPQIDPNRVYVTGLSNGGAMTQRMACQASAIVRGAAAVSFPLSLNLKDCPASAPLNVITIQGSMDYEVPYGGGPVAPIPKQHLVVFSVVPASTGVRRWSNVQDCTKSPPPTSYSAPNGDGDTITKTFTGCGGAAGTQVQLVTLPTKEHITYNTFHDQGNYLRLGGDPHGEEATIAEYLWSTIFKSQ